MFFNIYKSIIRRQLLLGFSLLGADKRCNKNNIYFIMMISIFARNFRKSVNAASSHTQHFPVPAPPSSKMAATGQR